jgi:hypothetical protein
MLEERLACDTSEFLFLPTVTPEELSMEIL